MKISDISKAYGVVDTQSVQARRITPTRPASKTDKVSLSDGAKDFRAVLRGLKAAPDVREDKVAESAKRYEAGENTADSRTLAERLLSAGLARKL